MFPGNLVEPVSGEITFVSPEVEPVNQQVRIWAEFENPEKHIRPGLITTMEVEASKSKPVDGETQKEKTPPAKR